MGILLIALTFVLPGGTSEAALLHVLRAVARRAERRYWTVARAETERVLKQRNALLRSAGGRLTPDVESTQVVWN